MMRFNGIFLIDPIIVKINNMKYEALDPFLVEISNDYERDYLHLMVAYTCLNLLLILDEFN